MPEIRPIAPDELVDWVAAVNLVFHAERSAAAEADYRRDVLEQDVGRTLAALDPEQHIVGTLYSFSPELALPGGTTVQANALSSVSVLPTHRRRGVLTRLLDADLHAARDRGEPVSILIAAEYPIYGRFGYGPAAQQASLTLNTSAAAFRRAAAGTVTLLPAAELRQVAPGIFDEFRRGRPGQIDRSPSSWDARVGQPAAPWDASEHVVRCAVFHDPAGRIQGYLMYGVDGSWERRLPTGALNILELMALTPDAYLGLWRYCCDVDLVTRVTASMRCVDEPLPWLLHNPRAALPETRQSDMLWLRPLDVPATLAARAYATSGRLVLDVRDPLNMCGGRFVLEGSPDGASCRATEAAADLSMDMAALGTLVLGGTSPLLLGEAGFIEEHRPGALRLAEQVFRWPVTPWCSTFF